MTASIPSAAQNLCACGAEISRWQIRCRRCGVQAVIDRATVVAPSAPLMIVDSDDTFFSDLEDAAKTHAGQHAHPCDQEPLSINPKHLAADLAERAVDEMCEEAFEGSADYVKDEEKLREAFETALEIFNAAQTASSWVPRTNEVFVIPASATEGDAQ